MSLTRRLFCLLAVLGLWAFPRPAKAAPSLKQQEREALRRSLWDTVQNSPLGTARVSIQMISLDDGSVVFAHNPDELLNPASNVKLVTAAAALARLGLDYRFETEFLTDDWPKEGKARTLYVRGKGDPSMSTERLWGIVAEIAHAGLSEISGDLIVDDAFFDADRVPPGYDQEDGDRSYMAPPGALSLNSNTVGVYLRPGAARGAPGVVELEPPSDFFIVDNRLSTGSRLDRRFEVSSRRDKDGRQRLGVTGKVPLDRGSWSVWKKIDEPALYFGHTLRNMLALRGVTVKGRVKGGLTPPTARILLVSQSEGLDVVLKRLNKNSSNFVAENLVKAIGAEAAGTQGTTANGIDAIEQFLEKDVGLPRGSYVMKNGSGLNDTNRFSSAQLNRVLQHMYDRFALGPEYLSSLTIAGKDGTLKYRFEGSDAVGRLRAKTGTLENVSSLSGYVQAAGGEKFLFSVLVNDFPGRAGTVVKHIDALGVAVASVGARPPVPAEALGTGALPVVPATDELKARAALYARWGAAADRRNLPLLRTAFRTEKDPLLRLLVADAVFQSAPHEYPGLRMVLDSLNAQGDVYVRARKWAEEAKGEVPGVAALLEWAAAGDLEAWTRVWELAPVGLKEPALAAFWANALSDLARRAPDECLSTLRVAPVAESEAGMQLLIQGLWESSDPQHPFWAALKKAQASPNSEWAGFAKKTEFSMVQALALRNAMKESPRASPPVAPARAPSGPEASAESRPGG